MTEIEIAAAAPCKQKEMLGNMLYGIIVKKYGENASEMVSKLLELENTQLMHFQRNHDELWEHLLSMFETKDNGEQAGRDRAEPVVLDVVEPGTQEVVEHEVPGVRVEGHEVAMDGQSPVTAKNSNNTVPPALVMLACIWFASWKLNIAGINQLY